MPSDVDFFLMSGTISFSLFKKFVSTAKSNSVFYEFTMDIIYFLRLHDRFDIDLLQP